MSPKLESTTDTNIVIMILVKDVHNHVME